MIPKIIHHIAPENRVDWSPIWTKCRQSWLDNYHDFTFMLWNDDDIDDLVFRFYPEYWKIYKSFPYHIMKIDFSRFCILQTFGGIYVDMDFYCYENFYQNLHKDIVLVGSTEKEERVQNSLMAANCNHVFLDYVLYSLSNQEFHSKSVIDQLSNFEPHDYIKRKTGPIFLSNINLETAQILDPKFYNPKLNIIRTNSNRIYTKHMYTGIWGKDVINRIKEKKLSFKDYYESLRNIKTKSIGFYE